MNPSREEALFALALAKPAERRAAFLDAMCDGDAALRQRLDALLAAHEQPATVFATQAETIPAGPGIQFTDAPDDVAAPLAAGRPYFVMDWCGASRSPTTATRPISAPRNGSTSSSRFVRPSSTRTRRASSIATSSRRTSS